MSMSMSDELLQRIAGSNGAPDEKITISLDRRIVPILEKWRKREAVSGGKTRRQALGSVAEDLIWAADELLSRYAKEVENPPQREAEIKVGR